jgi:hypothetical protein
MKKHNVYVWNEKVKDIHFVKLDKHYVQLERVYKGEKYNLDGLTTTFVVSLVAGLVLGYVF